MMIEAVTLRGGPGRLEPSRPEGCTSKTGDDRERPFLQRSVARAALGVLVFANAVGLWLAALLLWPHLGHLAGPLTYGRWIPLHLDLHLYGWCSLPAIGLLLARFLPDQPSTRTAASLALAAWCGALTAGAVGWLAGHTSGKVFLDWSGPTGPAFAGAQLFLWTVLASGWWLHLRRRLKRPRVRRERPAPVEKGWWQAGCDGLLLLGLLGVPFALSFAEQPKVYPPVNPDSGGATGHSLLASSLGIIGLALALPALLGRPVAQPGGVRHATVGVLAGFAANWGAYLLVPHGNVSNHAAGQIAALGTLLVWPVWLVWWYRKFSWAPAHGRWLVASAAWAALLVLDGFVLFLPGALERVKFTNALVAHSHIAMAGMLTSLNMLMLVSLAPTAPLATVLARRGSWLTWNTACLLMVVMLTALGWSEGGAPRLIADGSPLVTVVYLVRFGAGAVMLLTSVQWLIAALCKEAALNPGSELSSCATIAGTREPTLQRSQS